MKLFKTLLLGLALFGAVTAYSQTVVAYTELGDSLAVNLQDKCLTIQLHGNDSPNANISVVLDSVFIDRFQLIGYSKFIQGPVVLVNNDGSSYFYQKLTDLWGY